MSATEAPLQRFLSILILSTLLATVYSLKPGGQCNDETPCESGICTLGGICSCQNAQVYDSNILKCVNRVGETCNVNEDCVSFSKCQPEWQTEEGVFHGKCRCSPKHFETPEDRTCGERANYGEVCDEKTKPCEISSHFVSCQDGTCQCLDNKTQIYDPIKKTCAIRTRAACYNYRSSPLTVCVQNAACRYFFSKRTAVKCECAKDYIETSDGFCRASFGHNCNSTSLCHSEVNLICSDGKCNCNSPLRQAFDYKLKKCANLVGTACDGINECISNAVCEGNDLNCQCKDGSSKTMDRLCRLDHGKACNSSAFECNSDAGLSCRNEVCECFDSSLEFDPQLKFCKANNPGETCGKIYNPTTKSTLTVRCGDSLNCRKRKSQDNTCTCLSSDGEDKINELCVGSSL